MRRMAASASSSSMTRSPSAFQENDVVQYQIQVVGLEQIQAPLHLPYGVVVAAGVALRY